jgi:hypothetical protein
MSALDHIMPLRPSRGAAIPAKGAAEPFVVYWNNIPSPHIVEHTFATVAAHHLHLLLAFLASKSDSRMRSWTCLRMEGSICHGRR